MSASFDSHPLLGGDGHVGVVRGIGNVGVHADGIPAFRTELHHVGTITSRAAMAVYPPGKKGTVCMTAIWLYACAGAYACVHERRSGMRARPFVNCRAARSTPVRMPLRTRCLTCARHCVPRGLLQNRFLLADDAGSIASLQMVKGGVPEVSWTSHMQGARVAALAIGQPDKAGLPTVCHSSASHVVVACRLCAGLSVSQTVHTQIAQLVRTSSHAAFCLLTCVHARGRRSWWQRALPSQRWTSWVRRRPNFPPILQSRCSSCAHPMATCGRQASMCPRSLTCRARSTHTL